MSQNECVRPQKIEEFLSGTKLTAEEVRAINNHITVCSVCRERRDAIMRHTKAVTVNPHKRSRRHH